MFFIGHRDTPESVLPRLQAAVERHITQYGVTEFVVGHYGAFDRMAASAVHAVKERYPHVKLTLLLPYHPSMHPIEIPSYFDGSWYPADMGKVPLRIAIPRANRYAVTRAQYVIAYAWQAASNARDVVAFAHNSGVAVYNLA